jgi:hypothetical protein
MSTTTLRIDEALRDRISRLAHALSQTPHSFMVEALAQKADEAEWRLGVQGIAQQRDLALQAGEPGIEWHEMKTYLRQRLSEATDDAKSSAKIKPKATTNTRRA